MLLVVIRKLLTPGNMGCLKAATHDQPNLTSTLDQVTCQLLWNFPFAYTRSSKLDKSSVEITMSSADKNDTLALACQVEA